MHRPSPKKGEHVEGHVCWACMSTVDEARRSPTNPERTDWCMVCNHNREGIRTTAKVGDRLKLGKTHECREDFTCTCSLLALEPDEKCPVHGAGEWPPRCGECGRFMEHYERDPLAPPPGPVLWSMDIHTI